MGNRPKPIDPMLSEATSGANRVAGRRRSSSVMEGCPPVVILITASLRCLMTFRNGSNRSGFWSGRPRSEEHTSEVQSLMRISYAVFCLKKKKEQEKVKTK